MSGLSVPGKWAMGLLVCAVAGYQVKLVDLNQERLDKGIEAIRANHPST